MLTVSCKLRNFIILKVDLSLTYETIMKRRTFIGDTLKTTALTLGAVQLAQAGVGLPAPFRFQQLKLPYGFEALEPHIDARTMDIHYNKHHQAYINNGNDALTADKIEVSGFEELFQRTNKLSAKLRNNSGGAWNHNFFWQVMKPGGGKINGKALDAINGSFGSVDKFKEQFTAAAMGRFGSGWAWLVKDGQTLKIGSTPNQDNPLMDVAEIKGRPLLAIDVWEHAYYLKYQNLRKDYISAWWNVVDWDFVAAQL